MRNHHNTQYKPPVHINHLSRMQIFKQVHEPPLPAMKVIYRPFIIVRTMKLITKSILAHPKSSRTQDAQNRKESVGYCCREESERTLKTSHYTKRRTDSNFTMAENCKDQYTNASSRNNGESRIQAKEWRVQLDCKILTISQIIGRDGTRKAINPEGTTQKRQKIEVSLSKSKRIERQTKKTLLAIPRLAEVQRQHPLLKCCSKRANILNSVEKQVDFLFRQRDSCA